MRKKVIAVCLAVLILIGGLTGAYLAFSYNEAGGPGLGGGTLNGGFSFPLLFSGLRSIIKSATGIRSDGMVYPMSLIKATQIATGLPEREGLPVVGDTETLLKILLERGALYDPSEYPPQLFHSFEMSDSIGFDSARRGVVTDAPAPGAGAPAAPDMAPPMDMAMEQTGSYDSDVGYSQTNEQVLGVNEGDIVKTDGKYIYAMSPLDNKIRIISVNGAALEVVSTIITDEIWGSEFYLIGGDRLVVVGSEYIPMDHLYPSAGDDRVSSSARIAPDYYGWYPNDFSVVLIYDITDRSAPVEARRVSMDGWSVSTRVIGDIVYLVTNKQIRNVRFDQADSQYILPYCRDSALSETFEPIGLDRIYYIPDTTDTNYLLIGAIDVYSDELFLPEAYLGAGNALYMSQNAMYLTKQRWDFDNVRGDLVERWPSGGIRTDVMSFAINGTEVVYTGMGTVIGSPINQYSMDEHKGYFRIATTDWETGTYVTVLSLDDMRTVGRTEPLAPGEQMQSMRFMGDMGYVVTFENMDPLFTIDLSDPHNPRVLGELKIPGFSQYLHPVGDSLLLGIGRDTQEIYTKDSRGVETIVGFRDVGMKVSLFDVSDPKNPREVDVLHLGEGWTEVCFNPRALMCDASRGLYGFLVENWSDRGILRNKAIVLNLEDRSISIDGTMTLGAYTTVYSGRLCFIGDMLYLVHGGGVNVYDYSSYELLGSLNF